MLFSMVCSSLVMMGSLFPLRRSWDLGLVFMCWVCVSMVGSHLSMVNVALVKLVLWSGPRSFVVEYEVQLGFCCFRGPDVMLEFLGRVSSGDFADWSAVGIVICRLYPGGPCLTWELHGWLLFGALGDFPGSFWIGYGQWLVGLSLLQHLSEDGWCIPWALGYEVLVVCFPLDGWHIPWASGSKVYVDGFPLDGWRIPWRDHMHLSSLARFGFRGRLDRNDYIASASPRVLLSFFSLWESFSQLVAVALPFGWLVFASFSSWVPDFGCLICIGFLAFHWLLPWIMSKVSWSTVAFHLKKIINNK